MVKRDLPVFFSVCGQTISIFPFPRRSTNAVSFAKQPFQFLQFNIFNVPNPPMQGIAFGNQVGLKGFGIIAQYARALVR